ncbi:MAG: GntR family transcriptional regulator [Rhizobiaceae bacterium]
MASLSVFETKRPLYQVIAESLIEKIEQGNVAVGDLLPSEAQLCTEYGVSRHTVREAIRALAGLGLVDAQPGVGTKVISRKIGSYVQTLKEISDLTDYVSETKRRVLLTETRLASDVQVELPGEKDTPWKMFEAVRYMTNTDLVIAWTQVFVLPKYGDVLEHVTDNVLVYSLIEKKYGIRTEKLRQSIAAIATPKDAAIHLGIEAGTPALGILREYISADNQVYEVSWSIHPQERYQHKMELVLSLNTN